MQESKTVEEQQLEQLLQAMAQVVLLELLQALGLPPKARWRVLEQLQRELQAVRSPAVLN